MGATVIASELTGLKASHELRHVAHRGLGSIRCWGNDIDKGEKATHRLSHFAA